ncbi:MAG: ADP-ribosyl-[dinitrogen reductase] hydrolase [Kribbellaceae bacterium]|nr:ADP-ribosyl-[dinitrogen reductase] hydrolase [Kribbellaceae bacterium]
MVRLTAAQADRACGVLLGAACGDALGAGYEFGVVPIPPPGERPAMIGGGLGGFAPGEWTDDTAQTFAVAAVAATGADLRTTPALDAVALSLSNWYAGGPADVGIQTGRVLRAAGAKPTAAVMTAAAREMHDRTGRSGGNGSLMRTSVVALAHLHDPVALVEAAAAVSSLTHTDQRAGQACALWCLAIRDAVLHGRFRDPRAGLGYLPEESQAFWLERLDEAERQDPTSFRPNGYVATALQAAWSAITHTPETAHVPQAGRFACDHLVDALEAAVRIGDDTDTVASIAGALLGARWGASAFPAQWRRVVHGWPGVTAGDLVNLALLTVNAGKPDGSGWPGCPSIDYGGWAGHDSFAVHPLDPQVFLSGASTLTDLPRDVTAVVTLCRLGRDQVPAHLRGKHVEFRILDTNADDNPNLEYVIDDAARTIARFRGEGETVLLHCAAAHSRTPTVAARYGVLLGIPVQRSIDEVCAVLPEAHPNQALVAALRRLGEPGPTPT